MRKLSVFNHVTLDGYFVDAYGDMSWAHKQDPEWTEFVDNNAKGGGELIFGRVTYELMAGYWPTQLARQNDPVVAERMNGLPKIVFSTTLESPSWPNTTVIHSGLETETRRLKAQAGESMVVFGSGTVVSQLTQAGLVDEYQFVVNPIVLGKGRTMFERVTTKLDLQLTSTRRFANGNLLLNYNASESPGTPIV